MKKKTMKILSVILTIVMSFSALSVISFAAKNETIQNPYENVNFLTTKRYKTALHTHTNASDGSATLRQSIERHAETGFDIVAVTDHGTTDNGWAVTPKREFVGTLLKLVGKSKGDLDYLGTSGTFADGTSYTYTTESGDDYLTLDDGRKILRIPYGIENNAVSINAHVNSWFAPYKYNGLSNYSQAISGVDKAGGLSVINHPGEYTQARYELNQSDAYNLSKSAYNYYFNKFYSLIMKYPSCLGIDINSKGDERTRFDRKLFDEMLTEAGKSGNTLYAICSSDAHQLDKIDTGSVVILADEQTSSAVRSALENGEFFGYSTCVSNVDEMQAYADGIRKYYGDNETANKLSSLVKDYNSQRDELAKKTKKTNVGVKYSALDDSGFFCKSARPEILNITVSKYFNTIEIDTRNALVVRFISDGKELCTLKGGRAVLDLDDYEDELGSYVRAEVFGEGGVVYTQSFTLKEKTDVKVADATDLGTIDFLFGMVNGLITRIQRTMKK